MVANETPITGCLIHRVIKYIGHKDICVRLSFRKDIVHRVNGIVRNSPLLPQAAGFSLNQCSVLLVVTGHA